MFHHAIGISNVDVEVRMRITPLPPGYRTFESQASRMIEHREGMVRKSRAGHCQDQQAQGYVVCYFAGNHDVLLQNVLIGL